MNATELRRPTSYCSTFIWRSPTGHAKGMLIITAPGQGAQTPGFLAPWLEVPGVAERLGAASELAGCDLIRYGTTADADEIRDTAIAQPLLVAAALAAAGALAGGVHADAAASAAEPTGMTAVLGGDEETVLAAIARHGLTPANINAPGQIVAAGAVADLQAFAADPPAGARLRPLQVAGAFHTRYMAPAVAALRDAAAEVAVTDPYLTLLCNADGAAVTTGKEWLERIVAQVAAPVRWDLCLRTMADLGVTAIIELPPAGTLTGLARRALPGVAQLAIKTPDQLKAARDLIEEHLSEHDGHGHGHLPEWRLIVAPTSGTFRSPTGPPLFGTVVARDGERSLAVPWPAEIIEWLVEDGDPVSQGQPLVRVQPQGDLGGTIPPDKKEGA